MGKFFILPNSMVIELYNFLQWILSTQERLISEYQEEIYSGATSEALEKFIDAYYSNRQLMGFLRQEIVILTPVQLGHFIILFDIWTKLYFLSDDTDYDDMLKILMVARKLSQCASVFCEEDE